MPEMEGQRRRQKVSVADMGICAAWQQAAAGQHTLWRPLGLPQGPCRSGEMAAWRPHPPGSARVGALGYAGARTRRRNACGCLAPGALSWSAAARGMLRARMCPQARVCWACRSYGWGRGISARPVSNAARTRLSTAGSSCRISLPMYCICRVRAPCVRIRCAATTASCRISGRSSRASWAAGRATSWTPSAYNACASRLR
jgi:hypothetical protein